MEPTPDHTAAAGTTNDPVPRWVLSGPVVLALALVARAAIVRDDIAGTLVAVAAVIVAAAVGSRRRPRLMPLALLLGPVALVVSPARLELAFNLGHRDQAGWFWFTVGVGVASGLAVAGAIATWWRAARSAVYATTAVVGAAAVLGAIWVAGPQRDLGRSLTDAERSALPTVVLLDFAYAPNLVEVVDGRLRVRLDNPTRLPHSFSVAALDLDVYVPPGRSTFLDVAVPDDVLGSADAAVIHCSIEGDVDLGMVGALVVG